MFDITEKKNKLNKVFDNVDCIAETMTKICQFIWCVGFDKFAQMYQEYGMDSKSYIEEKWNFAQHNFISWWCNLDSDFQKKVIKFVTKYYA